MARARVPIFVHHVAIGGHPVGADDHEVHAILAHQMRRRAVADERAVDAGGAEFPGGEAGALEHGPGLVHEDVERHAALVGEIHRCRGGAEFGDGQCPSVAMREDVGAGGDERETVPANGAAHRRILGVNGLGFLHEVLAVGGGFEHPAHGPCQVDRGWTGCEQGLGGGIEGLALAPGQGHAIRRGDADGGSATHDEVADGHRHLFGAVQLKLGGHARQAALIEQPEVAAVPPNGLGKEHRLSVS